MPAIEIAFNRRRLLFPVRVFAPDAGGDLTGVEARALLDTGATVSGIGPRLIRELDLASTGKRPLGSATEERLVSYYLFRIGFDAGSGEQPSWPYLFDRIDGFSWLRPTDFDVIVGMDILSQCDLLMPRGGPCTLRFGAG